MHVRPPAATIQGASGWERLEQIGAQVERSLLPVLKEASFPIHFVRAGSLFWMSFHDAAAPRTARVHEPPGGAAIQRAVPRNVGSRRLPATLRL